MSFKIIKHGALPDNEYEIEGEINADIVKGFREEAIKAIGADIKMDGFRPGHIPEKVLVERYGEVAVTEEAGRIALEKNYSNILETTIKDSNIKPLGSPAVTITKVAPGEAFGFRIKTALMPEVKLGDYKDAAKKVMAEKPVVEVSDEEITSSIDELRKQVAHAEFHQANPAPIKNEKDAEKNAHAGHDHADGAHDHAGENHDHGDLPLPEVNEDFIKKFGPFKTVDEFKDKVRESIKVEKSRKEKDKQRLTAMDKILEKAEFKIPKLLIDSELSKMVNELAGNISQMGLNVETYLKHIGKTIEELRTEWLPDAEKRAKIQLALNQIALDEKITVSEEEMKKEVEQIMQYYKDADPVRAQIYVETILLNEKVWQFLDGFK